MNMLMKVLSHGSQHLSYDTVIALAVLAIVIMLVAVVKAYRG